MLICVSIIGMSKTAIHGLAKAIANEVGANGIRANVVSPRVIRTDFPK